jgi:hypothetical protein
MLNEITINKEMSRRDRMLVERNIIASVRFARSSDEVNPEKQRIINN